MEEYGTAAKNEFNLYLLQHMVNFTDDAGVIQYIDL